MFHLVIAAPLSSSTPRIELEPGTRWEVAMEAAAPVVETAAGRFSPAGQDPWSPRRLLEMSDDHPIAKTLASEPFLRAEAAWRGLERVLRAAAAPSSRDGIDPVPVRLTLISAAPGALIDALTDVLAEYEAGNEPSPDLIMVDAELGDGASAPPDDVEALAAWGAALGAPVLVGAAPALFGVKHAIHVPALADLDERLRTVRHPSLQVLRAKDDARWLGLVFGRWVTRDPYTETSDGFAETQVPEKPHTLPFAGGVWLAAAGLLRSLRRHGHGIEAAGFWDGAVHTGVGLCDRRGEASTRTHAYRPTWPWRTRWQRRCSARESRRYSIVLTRGLAPSLS